MEDQKTTQTPKVTDAPETPAKKSVMEYLTEIGMKGMLDAFAISTLLGTITPRTVRYYTNKGDLKPLNQNDRWKVYTKDAVADFLLLHPKFAMQRVETWKIDENTPAAIKDAIHNGGWNALLKYIPEEDLVSEVLTRLLNSRRTPAGANCTLKTIICRRLSDIWQKVKRDPMFRATQLNENTMTGDENE